MKKNLNIKLLFIAWIYLCAIIISSFHSHTETKFSECSSHKEQTEHNHHQHSTNDTDECALCIAAIFSNKDLIYYKSTIPAPAIIELWNVDIVFFNLYTFSKALNLPNKSPPLYC